MTKKSRSKKQQPITMDFSAWAPYVRGLVDALQRADRESFLTGLGRLFQMLETAKILTRAEALSLLKVADPSPPAPAAPPRPEPLAAAVDALEKANVRLFELARMQTEMLGQLQMQLQMAQLQKSKKA